MVCAVIVCDGQAGQGCPRGSVLEVELVERSGKGARELARRVLEPHGWVAALPGPDQARLPGAYDPLCPHCGAERRGPEPCASIETSSTRSGAARGAGEIE
jgi:hypothetical protein